MPDLPGLHHVCSELNITYGGGWDGTSQITSSSANCVIITLLTEHCGREKATYL